MAWPFEPKMQTLDQEVSFTVGKEYGPEFERTYTTAVPRQLTMKITIRWYIGRLFYQGELDQPDRNWVLFDPQKPAEKILDREILPEVQRLCAHIIAADAAWRASKPKEFTDQLGVHWVRTN